VVPRFDKMVGCNQSCHGEFEFFQVGRIRKLVCERRGGVEKLAVADGTVGGVEVGCSEEFDGEVGAARIMEFGPTSGRNLRAEAERVHVVAGEGAVTFIGEECLSLQPEGVEWAGDTGKEAGWVE
jgi:hypothetical protein